MNPKSTWNWILVALVLFAFIFFFERHLRKPETVPPKVLPEFKTAAVTTVQVRPAGQLEIRADRTNDGWVLSRPVSYPGQAASIGRLLDALEHLLPVTSISARELRELHRTDAEYGFDSPQFSLNLQQGDARTQMLIGDRTAPGDQVYLQVVGVEGVFVVDADLLKLIPRTADDWRDTAFADLRNTVFDRLTITSSNKVIELQRDAASKLWRMTFPLPVRVDNERLATLLQKLQALRVMRFVPDDPKTDLETFGLQPAELEMAFANGTNTVARLQFGRAATNDAAQMFARRAGYDTIVTVSKDLVAPWRAKVDEFRDKHLLPARGAVEMVEVRGENNFILQRSISNSWSVVSENFPVDSGLVGEFIGALGAMQIVQFNNAITELELPAYGLTNPVRQIVLHIARAAGDSTNESVVQLSFGATQDDKIFVRRADENSIYSVSVGEFQALPAAGWRLRDRRLWHFTEDDVVRLTIRQNGRTRELLRNGTNSWSFAPGSQGILDDVAVAAIEETVHRLGETTATDWVARGDESRAQYGFGTNGLSLAFELKSGEKLAVEFGGMSTTQYPYAASTLGGQTWIFQFPIGIYQYVKSYLVLPTVVP